MPGLDFHLQYNLSNNYRLIYKVALGNFKGETDWTTEKETYQWTVTKSPNMGANVSYKASRADVPLTNDVAVFEFDRVFRYGATVHSTVKWVGKSVRSGGPRTMRATDDVTGKILLGVSPRID